MAAAKSVLAGATPGFTSVCCVDANWIITQDVAGGNVGQNVLDIPWCRAVIGPDYEFVMETRQPLTVRRLWMSTVWETYITPTADGGLNIEYRSLMDIPHEFPTLKHLCECATQVSAVLEFHGPPPASSEEPFSTPGSRARARLRAAPAAL